MGVRRSLVMNSVTKLTWTILDRTEVFLKLLAENIFRATNHSTMINIMEFIGVFHIECIKWCNFRMYQNNIYTFPI